VALGGEDTPTVSTVRTVLVECLTGIPRSSGSVPLALNSRLGEIARPEHARRSVEIAIESFGRTP
jgi:hypothetical protein